MLRSISLHLLLIRRTVFSTDTVYTTHNIQEKAQNQRLTRPHSASQNSESPLFSGVKHSHRQPLPNLNSNPPSDLQLIHQQKIKKLKKESRIGIDSPFSLGLVYLQTGSFDRASFIKAAVRRRAKQPNASTSFSAIKHEKYLDLDNILIVNIIFKLYEHEIDYQRSIKQCDVEPDKVVVLIMNYNEISKAVVEDALILPPEVLYSTFDALLTTYPELIGLWDQYKVVRPSLPSQVPPHQQTIRNLTGFCLKYNMANKCDGTSCKYNNSCFICLSTEHPAVKCPKNPVKWKGQHNYGNYSRGRRGGYNNHGRRGGYHRNSYGSDSNYSQPQTPYDQNNQPPNTNNKDSNRARFNKNNNNNQTQ